MTPSPAPMRLLAGAYLLAGALCGPAWCEQPLRTANMGPFHATFGAQHASASQVIQDGRSQWTLQVDAASYLAEHASERESLIIDGETYRTSLTYRRGFGKRFEAFVDLPVLVHTGGVFDNFIEEWHEVFGLPQGGRDSAPQDRLAIRYVKDGKTLAGIDSGKRAIGDLVLGFGYQLSDVPDTLHGITLRAALQLPTGDEKRFAGVEHGALHLSASTSGEVPLNAEASAWSWFASLGAGISGLPAPLSELDAQPTWQARFGVAWQALSRLQLIAQASYQSSPYEGSEVPQISDASVLLGFGGRLEVGRHWQLEVAVVEDDGTHRAAADVGLRVALIRTGPG